MYESKAMMIEAIMLMKPYYDRDKLMKSPERQVYCILNRLRNAENVRHAEDRNKTIVVIEDFFAEQYGSDKEEFLSEEEVDQGYGYDDDFGNHEIGMSSDLRRDCVIYHDDSMPHRRR